MSDYLFKFPKFCVVGLVALIIDYSLTYLCKEYLKINKYISNSIGFITSAFVNYNLNRIWTFDCSENKASMFVVFLIIATIGLAINNCIIYLLCNKKKMNFYISKGIAIIITAIWNFTGNSLITFNN